MLRTLLAGLLAGSVFLAGAAPARADDIELPKPCMKCGKPLMWVFEHRKSTREFSPKKLSLLRLATVLWAAFGVNREDGKRTAPSSMNWQEIDVYAVMQEGAYRYDAQAHKLIQVLTEDIREHTGTQPFVKEVPLNLVYVADLSRMLKGTTEEKLRTSSMNTGFIAQNVYLYCTSAGLGTVARASVDKDKLKNLLGLRPQQVITLTQSVGYPKEE